MDEAGYDVIGSRPAKKPPPKFKQQRQQRQLTFPSDNSSSSGGSKQPTGSPSKMARSHSAEHLYEPTDFSGGKGKGRLRGSSTTQNSPASTPRTPRVSHPPTALAAAAAAMEGVESGGVADLEGSIEEAEQNHVYAQVVKKASKKRKQDQAKEAMASGGDGKDQSLLLSPEGTPPPLPLRSEDSVEVGGEEESEKREEEEEKGEEGEGEGEESKKKEEGEGEVQEVEHVCEGDHMYAMVSNVSRKKPKSSSLERGKVPPSSGPAATSAVAQLGVEGLPQQQQQEEGKKEANGVGPAPSTSPRPSPRMKRKGRPVPPKPAKPVPFTGKVPPSPGAGPDGGGEGGGVASLPEVRAKSPVRHAPPPPASRPSKPAPRPSNHPTVTTPTTPPSGTAPAPTHSDASLSVNTRTSRVGSISSRPPAFPPPPPPPASPSPEPSDEMGDHAYAVVSQSMNRASKLKRQMEASASKQPAKQAPPPSKEKMVPVDDAQTTGNWTSRAPHTYVAVEEGEEPGEGPIERTVSIPMKSHGYSTVGPNSVASRQRGGAAAGGGGGGSRKDKDTMRSRPSLPRRQTPPPPPPVSSVAAPPTVGGAQERRGSGQDRRGSGQDRRGSDVAAGGFLFSQDYASNLIQVSYEMQC